MVAYVDGLSPPQLVGVAREWVWLLVGLIVLQFFMLEVVGTSLGPPHSVSWFWNSSNSSCDVKENHLKHTFLHLVTCQQNKVEKDLETIQIGKQYFNNDCGFVCLLTALVMHTQRHFQDAWWDIQDISTLSSPLLQADWYVFRHDKGTWRLYFLESHGNLGQLPQFGPYFACLFLLKYFINRYGSSRCRSRMYLSSLHSLYVQAILHGKICKARKGEGEKRWLKKEGAILIGVSF